MSTVRYCMFILGLVLLIGIASALTPTAAFNGAPVSGTAPLTVSFTDQSTGSPTGWAWYFGDENWSVPAWTRVNASAGWSSRRSHSSVVMPDGSIVLMGGWDGGSTYMNDVWRSTDRGATWTEMTASAGWSARYGHSSIAMPDGSILLMGGWDGNFLKNDVWRSMDNGTSWILVNASAGWSKRAHQSSVVLPDGSIVLTGGYIGIDNFKSDVWRSTDNGATWTEMTPSAGWTVRCAHSSIAMPDASIVLMGGVDGVSGNKNDVWRSTDSGATWTEMTPSAGWSERQAHSSVVMPDGSIVLMGGSSVSGNENDVWRSTNYGSTWTRVNVIAGWTVRCYHSSVAMPDGSIVLTGGGGVSSNKNDAWRFMPAGSSAQNPSHTYTTPGTYLVSLQVYNSDVYNSTRKARYITVYPGIDYDSGSSDDTPSSNTPAPTTTPFGTTITETVNVGGGSAVTRAEVTGTNLGKNLVITAFPRNNLPSGIAAPNTTVYQYISITSSTIPGVVNRTTLDFSVPQSWLTEHGFTVGDVAMMHNENGQWQALDTRFVSQKGGNVYYRATTSGFSYFAIVYQKGGTNMGKGTLVATTISSAATALAVTGTSVAVTPSTVPITPEKTQAVSLAPVTDPVEGIPVMKIIIGTTGAVVTIITTVLMRRWWIWRQNPTLFRKYD
jgi:PGF-pre-PGF domain-containing protein